MPTVIATVGAENANSYVTVTEADTYFGERLNATAWTGASPTNKEIAVIMATRDIDRREFTGTPRYPLNDTNVDQTQALKWPRYGCYDDDGSIISHEIIPVIVKMATMERALELLSAGSTDMWADDELKQYQNVSIGPLSVTPRTVKAGGTLSAVVAALLRPVLYGSTGNTFHRVRA